PCGGGCCSTRSAPSMGVSSSRGSPRCFAIAPRGSSRGKVSARTLPATPSRFRVLFYGTPAFALPTLEAVLRHHEVVAVVTQPDRPAHRGQHLAQPPVKERALAAGIEVLQPMRVRDPEWPDRLQALGADVAVVVAFGH